MTYDRTDRIRRAAILVASLEETLAEQMLDTLPPSEATMVLAELERLGELDAEEVQDVLDEFRAAGRGGRTNDAAVEFTYSAPQAALRREPAPEPAASGAGELSAEQEADAALMAELLTREHPQTIAAALSRLGHELGAAVFAKLPTAQQLDVVDRLASLETADEDAVQELEVQLQRSVEQQRQRRDRATAAAELARRMLERTPTVQRDALLARITRGGQAATASAPAAQETTPVAARDVVDAAAVLRLAPQSWDEHEDEPAGHFEAWTDDPVASSAQSPAPVSMRILLDDRSDELEQIDDRSLLAALRVADERTVQCALAASSEKFLNRVAGKLPRRQANRLRQMVRSIGPTRLTELREAQHELLRLAHESRTRAAA